MKTHYTVVLAMLSGIGIGGLTVELSKAFMRKQDRQHITLSKST
jgi:hypothetical protein